MSKISFQEIFDSNERWIKQKLGVDPHYFEKLSQGQSPDYLYIGCSDSRVPAEEVMGLDPGDVFVHRNIANLVHGLDLNSTSVVEYAVRHLKVKHIIVCGHYGCGGVRAAMTDHDMGLLNPWLRNVRDVFRLHKTELQKIDDEAKKYDRLVELNVQEQCINVIKMAVVQKFYMENEFPMVHGWVFDIKTGKLIDLQINFEKIIQQIMEIYNLTGKH